MEISPELLKKYAANQCTELEKEAVEKWLRQNAEQDTTKLVETTTDQEAKIWNKISEATAPPKSSKGPKRKVWYTASAIMLVLIATGIGWLISNPDLKTFDTDFGQVRTIALKDGSKVYLNANSVLHIPEIFKEDIREVWLEGEAFFEVSKDLGRPFIVHTHSSRTKVLGTQFNLSEFSGNPPTLTLKEGKVAFNGTNSNQSKEVIILPNEQVTITGGRPQKRTVNPDNYRLWINGTFYVDGTELLAIGNKIKQLYGVEVNIATPELAQRNFRGTLANDDLTSLMEELSFVLDFEYEFKDNTITIY